MLAASLWGRGFFSACGFMEFLWLVSVAKKYHNIIKYKMLLSRFSAGLLRRPLCQKFAVWLVASLHLRRQSRLYSFVLWLVARKPSHVHAILFMLHVIQPGSQLDACRFSCKRNEKMLHYVGHSSPLKHGLVGVLKGSKNLSPGCNIKLWDACAIGDCVLPT